jgi:hypothetical protein
MADTLAEIYRNTLAESDFDSNGEATIVTTDSSTSHVIKSVQVEEVSSELAVAGTMEVNGFDIVGLTANSSGTEIIAPSSTVKVKTTRFPLEYVDYELPLQTSAGNYSTNTLPFVGDYEVTALSPIYDATNSLSAISQDAEQRILAPHLGPNDYTLLCWNDINSTTELRLYRESDGNVLKNEGTSYSPKWFDGKQYAYYYSSNLGAGLHRLDCFTNTETRVVAQDFGSRGTYPKLFGIPGKYVFLWAEYTIGTSYVYDIENDSIATWLTNAPNVVFAHTDKPYNAVIRSDGTVIIMVIDAQDTIKWWPWTPGDVFTGAQTANTLSLSGSKEHFRSYTHQHATKGSRLYYVNNDSEKLSYIDFETDSPTVTNIGTVQLSGAYGMDLTFVERTPSTSTINGRVGYPTPSLKLRVTGVTST